MRALAYVALPAAALAATCAYNPPPAPIAGDAETLGFLAGEWAGTYESEDTDRRGDIYFRLRAGADTAQGEVLMAPRYEPDPSYQSSQDPVAPLRIRPPPVVTIKFVRGDGPWVYGALDEYRDPDTDMLVQTTFSGRILADRIEGQFEATTEGSVHPDVGTWSVKRTGPPPRERTALVVPGGRDTGPPGDTLGLTGPTADEMLAQGRALFQDLGCAYCHRREGPTRMAPDLAQTVPHRTFGWIYRMMLNPDSMVRHDPVAKAMYEEYGFEMPDRGVTPWEALLLYDFMIDEMVGEPPPDSPEGRRR